MVRSRGASPADGAAFGEVAGAAAGAVDGEVESVDAVPAARRRAKKVVVIESKLTATSENRWRKKTTEDTEDTKTEEDRVRASGLCPMVPILGDGNAC